MRPTATAPMATSIAKVVGLGSLLKATTTMIIDATTSIM